MIAVKPSTVQIFRNVAETYSAQLLRIAGAVVFNIWLTRLLSPPARGYYGVGLAVAIMATQFGQFGLNTANTYFVAKEPRLRSVLLGNSVLTTLIAAPVLILIVFLIHIIGPSWIAVPNEPLAVALCYVPFSLAYIFFQGLLLGTHQIRQYNLLELSNRYIPLAVLGVCVLLSSVTPVTALAGVVLGQGVACIWAWTTLRSHPDGAAYSWPLMTDTLRYGVRIHLATVFSFILFRADLLMVAHMRGAAEAGYYSLATSLAEYMSLPASVAGTVLLPHLSSLHESPEKFRLMLQWLLGLAALMMPLFVAAAYIGNPIIRGLFGEKYLPSWPGFVWLLPGIYFLGLACIAVQFITSIGYKLSVAAAWFSAVVLNLAVNLYAIPHYGIVGASVSCSVCYALAFLLILLIAFRHRRSDAVPHRSEARGRGVRNLSTGNGVFDA
jgi:O-antigen/teichoic acid export membrane protein